MVAFLTVDDTCEHAFAVNYSYLCLCKRRWSCRWLAYLSTARVLCSDVVLISSWWSSLLMMIRVSRLSSSSSSCGRRCVTEWRGMSGCRRRSMESVFVVGGRDGSSPSPASVALQRIRALTSILNPGPSGPSAITVRYSSSSSSQRTIIASSSPPALKLIYSWNLWLAIYVAP